HGLLHSPVAPRHALAQLARRADARTVTVWRLLHAQLEVVEPDVGLDRGDLARGVQRGCVVFGQLQQRAGWRRRDIEQRRDIEPHAVGVALFHHPGVFVSVRVGPVIGRTNLAFGFALERVVAAAGVGGDAAFFLAARWRRRATRQPQRRGPAQLPEDRATKLPSQRGGVIIERARLCHDRTISRLESRVGLGYRARVNEPQTTRDRIQTLITTSHVVLFMKGTRRAPQCGFSASVVELLDGWIDDYATVDVIADPELREGI